MAMDATGRHLKQGDHVWRYEGDRPRKYYLVKTINGYPSDHGLFHSSPDPQPYMGHLAYNYFGCGSDLWPTRELAILYYIQRCNVRISRALAQIRNRSASHDRRHTHAGTVDGEKKRKASDDC